MLLFARRLRRPRTHRFLSPRPSRCVASIDRGVFLAKLGLRAFDDAEVRESFRLLDDGSGKGVDRAELRARLERLVEGGSAEALAIVNKDDKPKLLYDDYRANMIAYADKVDSRVNTLAVSFLATGASIGIIIPCMPLLVSALSISSSEFGIIVSSFGLAKLVGNAPSAQYSDRQGRKSAMVLGLGVCSVGLLGFSLVEQFPHHAVPMLVSCRFLTGFGVSFFTAGAFNALSDISTALNRARSFALPMSFFQSGIAFGPAAGGFLVESVGISTTYALCGGAFMALTMVNRRFLTETASAQLLDSAKKGTEGGNPFKVAYNSWSSIMASNVKMNSILILNGAYWASLSAVQMVTLPLFLISPDHLAMSAGQIGSTFAFMSVCSVLSATPAAYVADKLLGKTKTIVMSGTLLASAMAALPLVTTHTELALCLLPFSVASSMLQNLPASHVGDIVDQKDRSQALSLHRSVGDVGLMVGAAAGGMLVDSSSFATTIWLNSALFGTGTAIFAFRSLFRWK